MNSLMPDPEITANAVCEYIRRILTPGTPYCVPSADRSVWYVSRKSLDFSPVNRISSILRVRRPDGKRIPLAIQAMRGEYLEPLRACQVMVNDIRHNLPEYIQKFNVGGVFLELYIDNHPGRCITRRFPDSMNVEHCLIRRLRERAAAYGDKRENPDSLAEILSRTPEEPPEIEGVPAGPGVTVPLGESHITVPPIPASVEEAEGGGPPPLKLDPDNPDDWQNMPVSSLLARYARVQQKVKEDVGKGSK